MLSVILSTLLGTVLGAWSSLIHWSLGGVAVVLLSVVFVLVTAASWLIVLASIVAYSAGMFIGFAVVVPAQRASGLTRADLGPASLKRPSRTSRYL